MQAEMYDEDAIVEVEVPRGSCSIHDEYVVHGSGRNDSEGNRRTYVLAFRTKATVEKERSMGFTHSHNDETNWCVVVVVNRCRRSRSGDFLI